MDTNKESKTFLQNSPEDNKSIRTYYIAGSTLLHNALIALGYSRIKVEGHGLQEVKTFTMMDRKVKSSFHEVEIGLNTSTKPFYIMRYHGSSISQKLLESFTYPK